MDMPKISVVMPVHNAGTYLKQSLDTLLLQTLSEVEFICVDDGSTDDTLSILTAYAAKDRRICIIHQENAGAGAARNNGLTHAKGEYLSILDADDFYEPDMLEKAYAAAKSDDLDVIVFGCDRYIEDTGCYLPHRTSISWKLLPKRQPFASDDVPQDIFRLFVGWSWDKLFKRSFIQAHQLQFQVQRTTNDMLFVMSALIMAKRIAVIPDVLVHHRETEGTLSVTREKSWHCFYDALTALKDTLEDAHLFQRFEQDYINYCLHFSLWNLNTLKEPTRTKLYCQLKEEWFAQMGIPNRNRAYFYSKNEYAQYRWIQQHDAQWNPGVAARIHMTLLKIINLIRINGVLYVLKKACSKLHLN